MLGQRTGKHGGACWFTTFIVERDKLDLTETVKLFFAVSNAVFDASIATWKAKRFYGYCRPITAIRYLFRGKTVQAWGGAGKDVVDLPGELWRPFQADNFPTPPFSEYVSGHSTFSMAAATVLKAYTGSNQFGYFYMQRKPLTANPPEEVLVILLIWNTFRDAAFDASESRLYGGIHFYEGNVAGLELGKKLGTNALKKAQAYWAHSSIAGSGMALTARRRELQRSRYCPAYQIGTCVQSKKRETEP